MLADSVTDLHAARLITYEAAAAHDRGEDIKSLHGRCSIAKLFASEAAWRVADRAVQIFGGRGYMRENVAERFLRELRADRIWEGTSEIQRLIVARSLAKRGLAGTIGL
jgi:alkylation response protein AidB-like acyl-CoA dehydrogenase